MVEVISNALVELTAPNDAQVTPSVEYCHVPVPFRAVMAMPLTAPASTSAQLEFVKRVEAVTPADVEFSFMPVKLNVAPLVIVGASFRLETTIEANSVAVLKAVVVPLVEVSTFVPAVPVV